MNPLSALHGAMSRERKPFTYTPGGIDLSQIKSERMAKRLMRNAMDQGVPEHPTTNIQQLPPTLSTPLNVPNYNCLPVQVFPTFPLPTNPKSLLKTRTNAIDQKDRSLSQAEVVKPHEEELTTNKLYGAKQCIVDDNKHNLPYFEPRCDSENNEQYFPPYEYNVASIAHPYQNYGSSNNTGSILSEGQKSELGGSYYYKDTGLPLNEAKYENVQDYNDVFDPEPVITKSSDRLMPLDAFYSSENTSQNLDTSTETDNKQKEVKVVKKQAKSENITEGQNGDTDVQAAVTVKLPGKKSAAKTETKVEVVKNVKPDGSVEEVKTTTTKTTIDGKTEIVTKTETTIIPKEDDYEEEEVVEEEEEEEEEEQENNAVDSKEKKLVEINQEQENIIDKIDSDVDNEEEDEPLKNIIKQEESSESSVVKKVTIVQSSSPESSEDELEQEEKEEKGEDQQNDNEKEVLQEREREYSEANEVLINGEEESEDEDEQYQETDENQNGTKEENDVDKEETLNTELESKNDEIDETEDTAIMKEENDSALVEDKNEVKLDQSDKNEVENKCEDSNENQEILIKEQAANDKNKPEENEEKLQDESPESTQENKEEIIIQVQVLKPDLAHEEGESKTSLQTECNIPLREPSVPLEKVEDVEIKPIGQIISKHTENTEIITTSLDKPATGLSTQTAYNRIENIVTVNRTTKTLDHAYEQISQHNVPIVKTSFVPNLENISSLPQLSRPYQPVYPPEPQTERRHSLLLDRISIDRQMAPTESYQSNIQYTNQNFEQNQWTQEPQSEVLTVSNVKPSTITKNQQWYQQTKKEDISYSTAAPSLNVPSQQWSSQPQQQQYLQPQPQANYQPQPQVNFQPQPQYQPSYVETQDSFKTTPNTSSTYQQSSFSTYTPKPTSWVNNNFLSRNTATPSINIPANQFSCTEKENTEAYLKPTQQFSSSYVPPPWEQDSQRERVVPNDIQPPYYTPSTINTVPNNDPTKWTPTTTSKFSKPKPTSYIPPAPNQSFVKPVTAMDPPKLPGRKTYYSEYERRYISVPESTYIPNENKFQAQPDPSPQYYYDNNDPTEIVEPEWRKELREFSEKTQTQSHSEQTLVKPPWEEDSNYYVPKVTTEYNPTPTWSQTLRPNTWRERSFESEFVRSKELPRTNTLGRGRPQSSYVKNNVSAPIPERPRGVSVDRYNSNTYKSPIPSEYPPVVGHTLDPSIGSKTYHNPNVPAYHSRASAEPREQSAAIPQARHYVEPRVPPVQSRSFKYLQWITGTED